MTPAAGGEVPKARSLASAVTGKGPGEVRVVCRGNEGVTSLELARRSIAQAKARASGCARASRRRSSARRRRKKLPQHQREARQEVQVPLGPGRRRRVRQQRPHRDHARPLHRAEVAQGAGQRPAVQPVDAAGGPERRADAELRVPGDLPERPEPDPRPGPRGHGRAAAPRRAPIATASPSRSSASASAATCRSRARASKPEDVILDAGKDYENPKKPDARPGGDMPASECHTRRTADNPCFAKHVVLRTDRSDGFVGRNFLMRGARSTASTPRRPTASCSTGSSSSGTPTTAT